jgi:hypothetical protein
VDQNVSAEARSAPILDQAVKLANWLGGEDRALTPGGVLRKPDVPAAGAVLGIEVPAKLRTAADIRELNRPWAFGIGAGLIRVADGKATADPGPDIDTVGYGELLERWLAGVRAVCAAETPKDADDGLLLLVLTVLEVLDGGTVVPDLPPGWPFWRTVGVSVHFMAERYGKPPRNVQAARTQYQGTGRFELPGLVTLLTAFGVVSGDVDDLHITDLGRWARHRLTEGLPAEANPALSAAEMIAEAARFSDERTRDHVASGWLGDRDPVGAVREILMAASAMTPAERVVAIRIAEGTGDAALPAWREMATASCVGPYAKTVLWEWEQLDDIPDADLCWLAVEQAAVALTEGNTDEALTILWVSLPGDNAEGLLSSAIATGHPEANAVAMAISDFIASGAPRSIDQVLQLKVTLTGLRPAIWRSVQLPAIATLENLHYAIQALFGWDGDHLYVFTVGKEHYSGAFGHLKETGYDQDVRLATALSKAKKIGYVYDLGAQWEHEITLEKTLPLDPQRTYPACVAFAGGNPVEYPEEEDYEDQPEELEPFDIDAVNRRLARDEPQDETEDESEGYSIAANPPR